MSVIVLEEAQYLRTDTLNDTLSRNIHETLSQRIVGNYTFNGLCLKEVKEYIKDRLK